MELAARLTGTSIRDFVVKSVDEAAIQIIERHKTEFGASPANQLFLPPLGPAVPVPVCRTEMPNESACVFSIAPLPHGFASVLESALHGTILYANDSVETAAITALRFPEGEAARAGTIPGVVEPMTEIGHRLGHIPFRLLGDGPKMLRLRLHRPGTVVSGMIEASSDVEIVDRDVEICTLSEGGRLDMEMRLRCGRGIVTEAENRESEMDGEFLPLRSDHRPLRGVRLKVGQSRGCEKLLIELQTNGTVPPLNLLRQALDAIRFNVTEPDMRKRNLARSIHEFGYSCERIRTWNCLMNAKVETVGDLIQKTEEEILRFDGSGRKVLAEVKAMLAPLGFSLGMIVDEDGYAQPGPTSVLSGAILLAASLRLDD